MKNNNDIFTKYALKTTALALVFSLTMTGCSQNYKKHDKFYFTRELGGRASISSNDYISYEYIKNYYVIEVYNLALNRNQLYIARKQDYHYYETGKLVYSKYFEIFSNNTIAYDDNERDCYEFIKVIPLTDYLVEYNLVSDKYTYEDMKNIYELISENYEFQDYKPLIKVLEDKNKI